MEIRTNANTQYEIIDSLGSIEILRDAEGQYYVQRDGGELEGAYETYEDACAEA